MFKVDTTLSRSNVPRTIRFTEDIYNTLMEISSYENISFNQLVLQCCLYAINDYPMKEKLDNN